MELVVASALMAALMVGLWGLVNVFTSLANKGSRQLQRIRDATEFFQRIEIDLRGIPATVGAATPSRVGSDSTATLVGSESTLEIRYVPPPSLPWLGRSEQPTSYQRPLGPTGSEVARPLMEESPREPALLVGRETEPVWSDSKSFGSAEVRREPVPAAWPAVHRVQYSCPAWGSAARETLPGIDRPQGDAQRGGLWRYDLLPASGNGPSGGSDRRPMTSDKPWFGRALQFAAVEAVRFSYFDGQRWAPRWNSTRRGGLPMAVRVEAWFVGGSDLGSRAVDRSSSGADMSPDRNAEQATSAVVSRGAATRETTVNTMEGGETVAEQATSAWTEALSPVDTRLLPQRRADLTRWVALQ